MHHTTAFFAALLGSTYTLASPASSHATLTTRQTSINVPSECRAICDPPLATASSCLGLRDCCTATFETQYYNCLVCVGTAINMTDYSEDQVVLNELEQNCTAIGLGIPTLFLPGQGGDSSSSPSRSVTNSGSSTSTRLPTLSVPPLQSTIVQTTVLSDTRVRAPASTSITASEGNGTPTTGAHVSFVWTAVLSFVVVAMKYL